MNLVTGMWGSMLRFSYWDVADSVEAHDDGGLSELVINGSDGNWRLSFDFSTDGIG